MWGSFLKGLSVAHQVVMSQFSTYVELSQIIGTFLFLSKYMQIRAGNLKRRIDYIAWSVSHKRRFLTDSIRNLHNTRRRHSAIVARYWSSQVRKTATHMTKSQVGNFAKRIINCLFTLGLSVYSKKTKMPPKTVPVINCTDCCSNERTATACGSFVKIYNARLYARSECYSICRIIIWHIDLPCFIYTLARDEKL